MDLSPQQQRKIFVYWMRTGRRLRLQPPDVTGAKFNPWHDRATGQFTFRGGGGLFGGAGASGSAEPGRARPPTPAMPDRKPGLAPQHTTRTTGPAGATAPQRQTAAPPALRVVTRNGYEYRIDGQDRTVRVSGNLTIDTTSPRSRTIQARAGKPDRLPSDDGGHYIAPRFNGPAEAFNHFAQDRNFNRGRYRALEDQWARAKRRGETVSVQIIPRFDGLSRRPSRITVIFNMGRNEQSVIIPNRPKRRV